MENIIDVSREFRLIEGENKVVASKNEAEELYEKLREGMPKGEVKKQPDRVEPDKSKIDKLPIIF